MLLYTGLIVTFTAIFVIIFQYTITNFVKRDLAKVKRDTERLSSDLMLKAYNALQSDTIRHMVRIQELLDLLAKVDGTLVKYEVNKGKVTWEALVPQSMTGVPGLNATVDDKLHKDGRARIKGTR